MPFVQKGAGHGFAKAQMISVAEFKHPAHSSPRAGIPLRPVDDIARDAAPSTIERRYSSKVTPWASAWAINPASTSGLRFNVTVTLVVPNCMPSHSNLPLRQRVVPRENAMETTHSAIMFCCAPQSLP